MRVLAAVPVLLFLLMASPVSGQAAAPATAAGRVFGDWDDPSFAAIEVPGTSAPEPTIGIPWTTDHLFFYPVQEQELPVGPSSGKVLRATFDATGKATWDDVSPPYLLPTNLDPMLVADPDTGRVFAGGLFGPCSNMVYSDDDGATWLTTVNMCSGRDFDHQSIGLGPPAGPIPSPEGSHVGYYCAQLGTISCARSLDQGTTWGPFQTVPGSCGGFHGHIRVSPATGFVTVPTSSCGEHSGFISSADGGLTWQSNEVPMSAEWTNGFDPGIQFSRPGGWMYYAMASEHGVYVGLSKDEGKTWEPLGAGMGVEPTPWLDIGQFHAPPVVSGVFTNVQAGDDERVAVSFIGLAAEPGDDLEFLKSNRIYQCDDRQEELVWHQYVAFSYDAGQSWTVTRASPDPIQVGGIYDSVVDSQSGACRNLLDFNDMDIDSMGRVHLGVADGCVRKCAETLKPGDDGYRTRVPLVYRQSGGRGLFAQFDGPDTRPDLDQDGIPNAQDTDLDGDGVPNSQERDVDGDGLDDAEDGDLDGDGVPDETQGNVTIPQYTRPPPGQEAPGLPAVALLAALAAAAVALRRRA